MRMFWFIDVYAPQRTWKLFLWHFQHACASIKKHKSTITLRWSHASAHYIQHNYVIIIYTMIMSTKAPPPPFGTCFCKFSLYTRKYFDLSQHAVFTICLLFTTLLTCYMWRGTGTAPPIWKFLDPPLYYYLLSSNITC